MTYDGKLSSRNKKIAEHIYTLLSTMAHESPLKTDTYPIGKWQARRVPKSDFEYDLFGHERYESVACYRFRFHNSLSFIGVRKSALSKKDQGQDMRVFIHHNKLPLFYVDVTAEDCVSIPWQNRWRAFLVGLGFNDTIRTFFSGRSAVENYIYADNFIDYQNFNFHS